MEKLNLIDVCHVVKPYEETPFVGIKCSKDNINVWFPVGFELGKDDDELRRDVLTLLQVLSNFTDRTESEWKKESQEDFTGFPIYSYLYIIKDFLTNGYYVEKEIKYNTAKKGKINWSRTIKTQRPYPLSNGFVYLDFVVKDNSINQNELITLVHEACVYRCFKKLGWLYTAYEPQIPRLGFDKDLFETVVMQSMSGTFNDKKRELFGHLLKVISEESNEEIVSDFSFGTTRFEYVWEKMIDYVFGISNKEDYFPHSNWHLKNKDKQNSALEPDTIMIKDGIAYILDAKYYKYGVVENGSLPATASIAKQIIYAEYIEDNKLTDDDGNILETYNAFIMPFSKSGERFKTDKNYKYIGYADADWKDFNHRYEHIEGILLDVNYLMNTCTRLNKNEIEELSQLILDSFE